MYQNLISYLYEAQHVMGDTAHHQEPKTVLAASGFAYVQLHVQQPSTYAKPEAACGVLGS